MPRKDIYERRTYAAKRTMRALHRLINQSTKLLLPSEDTQAIRWMKAWSVFAFAHVPLQPKRPNALKAESLCTRKMFSLAERSTTTKERL